MTLFDGRIRIYVHYFPIKSFKWNLIKDGTEENSNKKLIIIEDQSHTSSKQRLINQKEQITNSFYGP